jgi:hypothetical protein
MERLDSLAMRIAAGVVGVRVVCDGLGSAREWTFEGPKGWVKVTEEKPGLWVVRPEDGSEWAKWESSEMTFTIALWWVT